MLTPNARESRIPPLVSLIQDRSLLPDNEIDINTSIDSELGDFLDDRGGALDVDDPLVHAHLVLVPGVGSVSARRSACGDRQLLSGNANWASGLVAELFRFGYDFVAGELKGLDLPAAEGHADFLDLLWVFALSFLLFFIDFSHIRKATSLINNKQSHLAQLLLRILVTY